MSKNLLQLPNDIIVYILKKLSLFDICNVILTCKTLRSIIINNNTIWRNLFRNQLILNISSESHYNELSMYNRCRISNNWCNGIYKNKVLIHFSTNYMPQIQLYDSMLLVATGFELNCYPVNKQSLSQSNIKPLWTLEIPTVKRNDIRPDDISKFIIKDCNLVCGNIDGGLSVYTIDNIKEKPQLKYHIVNCHREGSLEVTDVAVISRDGKHFAITASMHDNCLMFWDCTGAGKIERKINIPLNNGDGVRCLSLHNDQTKLAMGLESNSRPILLDIDAGKYLMTSSDTKYSNDAVRDVVWHNENTIASVTHSGLLRLHDIRTQSIVYDSKDPFHSTLYCIKSDHKNALVAGSCQYSRCVLYDVRHGKTHRQLYFTHRRSSPVYSLDFDGTYLFSAVDRGIITLNFNVSASNLPARDYSQAFY